MKIKEIEPPISLKASPEGDMFMVQLWAIGLVRIVGKFSSNLGQSPSSIYRLIPPFCPHDFKIGRIYGNTNDRTVSATVLVSAG